MEANIDKNEKKKILYKEKPMANCIAISRTGEVRLYVANTSQGQFAFEVPVSESENFDTQEPAQLLIRWLV